MTLLVMLLTTATAWAEDDVPYFDPTAPVGQQSKTQDGVTVLTGDEITSVEFPLQEGWYIVKGTINYSSTLYFSGDVKLILADGCAMNMGTKTEPINDYAISAIWGIPGNLTIYRQEEATGELTIYADKDGIHTNYDGYITINGGTINTIVKYNGIFTGNLTMNGGTLNASSEESCGINVDQNITNNGGSINATGGSSGIMANGGNITINGGEVNATTVNEYGADYVIYAGENISIYNGTITINGDDAEDGIHANGNIIIKDGTITVSKDQEDTDYAGYAIYADGAINITGGTVVANGCYCGIYSEEGDITIEGGDVTATIIASGDSYGAIYAVDGDINISDGIVNASGGDASIYAYNGDVTISGGEVIVSSDYYGIYTYESGNIIINGGKVTANCTYSGIRGNSPYSVITINGGNITATATGSNTGSENNHFAIGAKSIAINGGEVTVYGTNSDGIYTPNITLNGGIVNATGGNNGINIKGDGSIVLNGAVVTATSYNGTVTIAEGLNYSDGTECSNTFGDLDNTQTLQPCVKAKKYDNNYWTTFYSGSVGFTIDDAVNAYAYTAELGTDEITMHLLGKVIPKETAVIIVSESETITVSADAATNVSTVPPNNLHGVDVATATTSVLNDYPDATTLYFLSNKNSNFGFHDFGGSTVPARKAFLALDDSNGARGFSMVFEDDATGIRSIDSGKDAIGNEAGAWYDLRGRRLSGKPSQRGIYVNNGKKIVIK